MATFQSAELQDIPGVGVARLNDEDIWDDFRSNNQPKGHGTGVASVLAGDGNAQDGDTVLGTAQDLTTLHLVKIFTEGDRVNPLAAENPDIVHGLFRAMVAIREESAEARPPDVINISLGRHMETLLQLRSLSVHVERTLDAAALRGVITVFGAGPSGAARSHCAR